MTVGHIAFIINKEHEELCLALNKLASHTYFAMRLISLSYTITLYHKIYDFTTPCFKKTSPFLLLRKLG